MLIYISIGFDKGHKDHEDVSQKFFWLLPIAWNNKPKVEEQSTQTGDTRGN